MEMTLDILKEMIASDKKHRIILDTDTYNEVDDQFCLAYCMLAKEKIELLSVNAAPFLNDRSISPADGMEQSYHEIFKVMKLVDPEKSIPVYRGSTSFLPDKKTPVESDAADNIIKTVTESEEPVIIVAIGAITNVASALIKCPELAKKTAVVWLGGHALHYWHNAEFNFRQDVPAAQVVFDSGIPLVQVPCCGVCTEFRTTVAELKHYLSNQNALCDYLVENVAAECDALEKSGNAPSRIIWDVTAAAVLICPEACKTVTVPRPVISSDGLYSTDSARPHYVYVRELNRDRIYGDLFAKLKNEK